LPGKIEQAFSIKKQEDEVMPLCEREDSYFRWPSLSDSREEEILEAIHLFAKALHYEIAPLLESIRSNAELLGGVEEGAFQATTKHEEAGKISPYRRLFYIAQQSVQARRILEKAQQLSSLRTKTRYGIEMLDLEETLTSR
jgi:hypothetical protein